MLSKQPTGSPGDFRLIPLSKLELGEINMRRRDITVDIDELAYSIKTFGLQHPIVVQPKNGKYEIVIGQRRYLAVKRLGWDFIPAKVIDRKLDEFETKVLSFSENVQRRDLSPRDKADTCSFLLKKLKTPQAVALHLGVTEQTVRKWLDYADVPEEIKKLVDTNVITRPLATRLFQAIPDTDKAVRIAQKMKEMRATKDTRDRIIDSVEEAPKSPIDEIFARADRKKHQKSITFILPDRYETAMDRAMNRTGLSAGDIARDATIEWLQMLRY